MEVASCNWIIVSLCKSLYHGDVQGNRLLSKLSFRSLTRFHSNVMVGNNYLSAINNEGYMQLFICRGPQQSYKSFQGFKNSLTGLIVIDWLPLEELIRESDILHVIYRRIVVQIPQITLIRHARKQSINRGR